MSKVLKTTRAIAAYWLSAGVFISLTSSAVISGQILFISVDKGIRSGLSLFRTEQEWSELWRNHTSNVVPPKKRPLIDFNNEMVVAGFLGEQRSGGYGVEITRDRGE
jgi:hypothetical protein